MAQDCEAGAGSAQGLDQAGAGGAGEAGRVPHLGGRRWAAAAAAACLRSRVYLCGGRERGACATGSMQASWNVGRSAPRPTPGARTTQRSPFSAPPPPSAGKTQDKTATGLTYIPAPKLKLPGHEESYNPPKEYLPSEEERAAAALQEDEEERPQFVPTAYDCLRRVRQTLPCMLPRLALWGSCGWQAAAAARQPQAAPRLLGATRGTLRLPGQACWSDASRPLLHPRRSRLTPTSSRSASSVAWICTFAPAPAASG